MYKEKMYKNDKMDTKMTSPDSSKAWNRNIFLLILVFHVGTTLNPYFFNNK